MYCILHYDCIVFYIMISDIHKIQGALLSQVLQLLMQQSNVYSRFLEFNLKTIISARNAWAGSMMANCITTARLTDGDDTIKLMYS